MSRTGSRHHTMEDARLYSTANGLQRRDARQVLLEMLADLPLPPGARVLDVGCGSGDVTAEVLLPLLPPDIEEVVGIDISRSMINHAQDLHGCPQLSFMEMDIEEEMDNAFKSFIERRHIQNNTKPNSHSANDNRKNNSVDILINGVRMTDEDHAWPGGSDFVSTKVANLKNNNSGEESNKFCCEERRFDVIFSFYCLHWIQNQRQALKNMYSLLKHCGEVVLVFLASSTIFTLYEKLAEIPRWADYMQDVQKFISPYHHSDDPSKELADLASSLGFHVLSVQCRYRSFVYQDAVAVKDAIKAVNPFYPRLSASQAEQFLADCMDLVMEHNLAEHVTNGLCVNYTLLVAHLRK